MLPSPMHEIILMSHFLTSETFKTWCQNTCEPLLLVTPKLCRFLVSYFSMYLQHAVKIFNSEFIISDDSFVNATLKLHNETGGNEYWQVSNLTIITFNDRVAPGAFSFFTSYG